MKILTSNVQYWFFFPLEFFLISALKFICRKPFFTVKSHEVQDKFYFSFIRFSPYSGCGRVLFLKREEGYVSAYFIGFIFIIHTSRQECVYVEHSLRCVLWGAHSTWTSKGLFSGAGGQLGKRAGGVIRHILIEMLQWVPRSTGIQSLVTWIRPMALHPKIIWVNIAFKKSQTQCSHVFCTLCFRNIIFWNMKIKQSLINFGRVHVTYWLIYIGFMFLRRMCSRFRPMHSLICVEDAVGT